MSRFVLFYHECPPHYKRASHWDLMLEGGDVLRTWALAELPRDWKAAQKLTASRYPGCPALAVGNSVDAEQLGDHRRAYLDFEGPLSGNRGQVTRIDAGSFEAVAQSSQNWQVELAGSCIHGTMTLVQSSSDANQWLLTHQARR